MASQKGEIILQMHQLLFFGHNGKQLLLSGNSKLPGFENLGFGSPPTLCQLLLVAGVTEGTQERGVGLKPGL